MSSWRRLCLVALLATVLQMCEAEKKKSKEFQAITCGGSTLSISCLHKGLIRIVRANYGRFTITQCNYYAQTEGWDMQCHSPNSDIVVRQRCDGRVTCNIAAENDVFGADPCPSTYKYLDVHYICEKDHTQLVPKSQVAKVGDDVELVCSKDDMEDSSVTLEMLATTKWSKIEGNISSNAREERTKLIIPDVTAKDAGTYCCTVTFGAKSFRSKISLNISAPYPPIVSKVQTTRMTTTTTPLYRQPTTPRSTPRRRPSPSTMSTTTTSTTTASTTISTTTTTTRPSRTTTRRITKKKTKTSPRIPVSIPKRSTPTPTPTTRRIRKKCKEIVLHGVWWPPVNAGDISERPCPGLKIGIAKWECGQENWIGPNPNYTNCVAPWLQDIANTVNYTKPQNSMSELSRSMKLSKLGSGDIIKTTREIIPELTKILQKEVEKPGGKPNTKPKIDAVTNFTEGFISVGSAMLQSNQQDGWKEMLPEERSRVATSLTQTLESTAYDIASLLNMTSQIEIVTDNIKLEISVTEIGNTKDMKLPSSPYAHSSSEPSDYISIPKENLIANAKNGMVRVVCMLYSNLGDLLTETSKEKEEPEKKLKFDPSEIHHGKFSKTPQLSIQQEENASEILAAEIPEKKEEAVQKINTKILSVSMTHMHTFLPLEKPVAFVLKHNQEELTENPKCVYWDYTSSMDGHWSTEGCSLVSTNNTHTTCECNHLAGFAVLMDFIGTKLPSHHEQALYIITMVGCIISIIGLFCCFFTFCYFRNLQCERNTIHKNLVLSLMLAEIVFLAGIQQTQYKILCSVVAGVLHYLFLVAFAWMCLEGILLYIMLIEVFEAESRRTAFYLFGYGIPAIIVTVSLGLDHTGYGTDQYCWLRTDNYFILSFVIPVGLIIVINISMLLLAIYMMHTHANTANSKERSTKEKINGHLSTSSDLALCGSQSKFSYLADIPGWIKGAVVLMVLLGLTWGFGLFYVNEKSVVMAYIFTILNSLQGLLIFIFHCVMNEKVCKEYKKAIKNSSWIPACIKSICSGGAGDRSSTPNPSTSSGNFISKLWSRKRKTSSTSNSIKTPTRVKSPVSVETCGDSDYQTSKQIMSDYDYPTNVAPRGKQSLYQKDVHCGADELSTFDCSVIDSEYVSEYCQTNLQVNQEQNRLSPVSSNESLTPSYADSIEKNRLSLLSKDSDLQQNNSFSSDKMPVLDEDLMKLAVKERLYDYETEPLMYTNMNTSEAEQNMINNMLNDGDSGISNGPQLMANHHHYSVPCCQPLQTMGEDCSQQLLMQRGIPPNMHSIPGYPIYHDYSHSNNYSSVDVGVANDGRIPAERMQQHRADDQLNPAYVRHGGKRMEKLPSFSEC